MKLSKQSINTAIRNSLNAVFILSGIGLVGYGAYQVYEPASFVVVGLALVWMGLPDRA